jgi:hypothetical protein
MLAWACVDDRDLTTIVYERFRLYADKAMAQKGSEFLTAQVIGVIRWLGRAVSEHAELHRREQEEGVKLSCRRKGSMCDDPDMPHRRVAVVGQWADIKVPTAGVLRSKKIRSLAKREKAGPHCVDAELHGWYYLLHRETRT